MMNRLKKLRKEKGLSQKAFSEDIGVSYRTIQNWENGESQIKPDKAQALADFFGVNVGYLLGYSDTRYSIEQIEKAITERIGNPNEQIGKNILDKTLKLVERASFLNLDLETIIMLYFYISHNPKIAFLNDLFAFFDAEIQDYKEMLSIVEPWDADKIIQEIAKLSDYGTQLSLYLNKIKSEEFFFETSDQTTNVMQHDEKSNKTTMSSKEIENLQNDVNFAIRLLDRINSEVKKYEQLDELNEDFFDNNFRACSTLINLSNLLGMLQFSKKTK